MTVSRLAAVAARRRILHGMDEPRFLSGKLLLAMPGMADPRFERAVIAMCVHDENGAVGIGIGHKRAGIGFRGLLEQLGIDPGEAPDCAGPSRRAGRAGQGLRAPQRRLGRAGHASRSPGSARMTGTIDVLKAIAEGRGPSRYLVALGYAGWGEGQLDEEMTRHGWFAADGDPAILFDTPTDERWEAAFQAEGIDPRLLASETGAA